MNLVFYKFNAILSISIIFQLNKINFIDASNNLKLWSKINLPKYHMPYFFFSNKSLRKRCIADANCPFKAEANTTKCWGYEPKCTTKKRIFEVECPGDYNGWVFKMFFNLSGFFFNNFHFFPSFSLSYLI